MSEQGEPSRLLPQWLPPGVDTSLLVRAAQAVLDRGDARVTEWRCRSIWEPRVVHTKGVYLFSGAASDGASKSAWSVVLKILSPAPDGPPPHEVFLYRSGFLASLSGDLVAPRCVGVDALPGGDIGIWLEHLADTGKRAWPIARFATAARHLGQFSGVQTPNGVLPRWPWLRHGDLRAALEARAANVDALRTQQLHPLVRRAYPPDVLAGFLRLWEEREAFLVALDGVPRVVCHGDAQHRNLFARDTPAGGQRTVAIDWENLRAWPLGTDAKTLVHQALLYFDADVSSAGELDDAVFGGYVAGLREAGWRGDATAVRIGYGVHMALGHGVLEIGPILRLALDERRRPRDEMLFGRPIADILDRRAAMGRFLLTLAEDVRSLV